MNRNKLLPLAVFVALLAAIAPRLACAAEKAQEPPKPPASFKGKIELDIRNSVPDWGPWTPKRAPEGAPNILFILYDDTGQAAAFRFRPATITHSCLFALSIEPRGSLPFRGGPQN